MIRGDNSNKQSVCRNFSSLSNESRVEHTNHIKRNTRSKMKQLNAQGLEKQQICSGKQNAPPDERSTSKEELDNGGFHHFRYVIIVLGGLTLGSMLFLRLSIAVPMVSMVNKTALYLREHPNATQEELDDFFPLDYVELGEFLWTNEIQQVIMTGYMIAYAIPQLFTTRLAMQYGIRISMSISLALCAISSLLTPIMSYWGWEWCLALRLINAVGASAIFPVMVNVIEDWMPPGESAKGLAIVQFVSNFGFVTAPLVSGYITHFIGWKAAFYIPGLVGLLMCLLWYVIASDSPSSSRFLTRKELNYIENGQSSESNSISKRNEQKTQITELPWYFMYKIKSFYFLSLVWGLYCPAVNGFLFLLPNYLNRVLQVPVEEIGALNFTVQIGLLFCMLWQAPVTSILQSQFNLSLTGARKCLVTFALFVVSGTYCYLAQYHDNLVPVIVLNRFFHMSNDTIVLSTIMSQFGRAGLSGLIYSVINAQGQMGVLLGCWAIGRYLDHTGETLESWSHIFLVMTFLVLLHFVVYVFFCHSESVEVKPTASKKDKSVEDGRQEVN